MLPLDKVKFCPACGERVVPRIEENRTRLACPAASCGHVLYGNPTPVVAALIEKDGEALLVRNKGWPAGWYGLVSGFLEAGETPAAGVLREVQEELGLDGEVAGLIGAFAFPERNEVILAYHVRARGEVRMGDELEHFKAVPLAKLRPWPFGTGLAVAAWLEQQRAHQA
ncbi:NUDIX hydrolase [Corallococcus coralloides DSM 2259]|uniref:NUDIX hydrolase n=1 Tax=Corallococcus coralloides (strain ATCC 25202 / DSM 2259 / NBRC 100086 / M2) TaxID=1144275 RepID=H8MRD7_CORCM|nr:NUDIX domain-containing protein [Corallococcus coralloides]AFE09651.1 NUDIX hydrolase [Corallococcus coralloides DSM 2259]